MGGSSSVTIGYKYYMGMHLAICEGPVDEFQAIFAGERLAWEGSITASEAITVNSPNLFGGEKKEGGVQGTVSVAMGEPTQLKNAYLEEQTSADTPAFRGTLSLILHKCYLTAMTRSIKPWAVTVKRIAGMDWYPAKAEIVGVGTEGVPGYIPGGSANGIHILYEAFTNTSWGLGLSTTLLDDVAFKDAADILYDENFGISLLFSKQTPVEEFVQTIIQHIGAVIYTSNTTGQFVVKLIRAPSQQELDDAPIFDGSNIITYQSYERPSFAEMINEVVLNYNPQKAFKGSTITMQDLASVEAQGGIVSQTVQFPGIDNAAIAAIVGQRELGQYSNPLAKVQFTTNRDGWNVNPGDIIKYQNSELGVVDLIVRVFAVNYGTLQNGEITMDGTQDIYTLPETSYLSSQDTIWVEPVQDPVAVTEAALFEMSYHDLANNYGDGDLETFDEFTAFLQVVTLTPASASASFQLWLSATTTIADYVFNVDGSYAPTVDLVADLPIPTLASGGTVTVSYENGTGIFFDIELGTYGYLETEMVEIVDMDVGASTITIKRAILDTLPKAHVAGSTLFFVEQTFVQGLDQYIGDPTGAGGGDTTYARMLTQTDIGVLDINDSTEFSHTFTGRQARPLPPIAVHIDNVYFPVARDQLNGASLGYDFRSRNRLLQITKPYNTWYDQTTVNIAETDTDYIVNQYGEDNKLMHVEVETWQSGSTSYVGSVSSQAEYRDAGHNKPGNLIEAVSTDGGQPDVNSISFGDTDAGHRGTVDMPLFHHDKVYFEFTADTDSFLVGVINNSLLYRQVDVTNVAYLQYQDNTLVGEVTGTVGTGTLHGGTAGMAIDQSTKTFWLRNINGTWRDGNPATSTGGLSFSTLVETITGQSIFFPAFANDVTTLPASATVIEFNLGRVNFTHDIPSGFVSYNSPPTGQTLIDTVEIGTNVVADPDGLNFAFVSGAWEGVKGDSIRSEGRWYFEVRPTVILNDNFLVGVQESTDDLLGYPSGAGIVRWEADGTLNVDGVNQTAIDTYTVGDRVGVAVDIFAGEVRFYKNGDAVGNIYAITFVDIVPMCFSAGNGAAGKFNFVYMPTVFDGGSSFPHKYPTYDLHEGETAERLSGSIRFEIYANRTVTINEVEETMESNERFDHTVDRNGWGYQYDNYYDGGDE